MIVRSTNNRTGSIVAMYRFAAAPVVNAGMYSVRARFGNADNPIAGAGVYSVDVELEDPLNLGNYYPVMRDRPLFAAGNVSYHQTLEFYCEAGQDVVIGVQGLAGDASVFVEYWLVQTDYILAQVEGPQITTTPGPVTDPLPGAGE